MKSNSISSPSEDTVPVALVSARRSLLAVAALFLALGFNYGTWASRLPAIKSGLGLDTGQLSVVLLFAALGSVFSFPVTALTLRRFGSRGACLLGGSLLAVMLVTLSLVPTWAIACGVTFVFGIAASTMDVAINAQGVELERALGRPVISRMHAVFSLGTMVGAVFASGFTAFTPSLLLHFATASLLVLALVLLPRGGLLADVVPADAGSRTFTLPRGATLWVGVMALLGMIVEASMVDWTTLYLRERAHASQEIAPLGIACVQGAMLVARWFGDGARARWGARKLIVRGSLVGGVSLVLALVIGGVVPALIGFALFGFGVATVAPCVYAAGGREGAVAFASVMTLGSLGFLIGPLMIGAVAQATNLSWGLGLVALSAFALAALAPRVRW